MEGEEGDAFLAPHGGDRADIDLPAAHIAYLKALRRSIGNKPLIAVVTGGSRSGPRTEVERYSDAIITSPGIRGNRAVMPSADILSSP